MAISMSFLKVSRLQYPSMVHFIMFLLQYILMQYHMISSPGKACEGAPPLLSTGSKVVISIVVIRKYISEFNLNTLVIFSYLE